jgi:hypothetical protein
MEALDHLVQGQKFVVVRPPLRGSSLEGWKNEQGLPMRIGDIVHARTTGPSTRASPSGRYFDYCDAGNNGIWFHMVEPYVEASEPELQLFVAALLLTGGAP